MELRRIEFAAIGLVIGVLVLVLFNKPINDLINVSDSSELRVLLNVSFILFCVGVGIFFPMGLAAPDMEAQ